MVCQPLRLALLIGAITAVAVSPVRANFRAPGCCDPCGSATTAPAYRTVTCTEWVRENVTTKKTVYRVECRTETYDTCRTECVPVCKDVEVCVTKRIPHWTEECRKVCKKVTVYEDKMVKKTTHKYVQETCMKKQLVRLGHWECKEVTPLFGGGLFSGHGHSCASGCGDACSTCAPACTKTRKVWVHCPEYRECPVTVCKKVCVTECVPCKVAVCKNVWTEEKVKVCKYTCVTEKVMKKVTTYEKRTVACKATRTVRVCVPHEETVTCCKLVPKTVTRQVPCAPACTNTCATTSCCPREGLLSRLKDRFGSCGCSHTRDCCRPACCN